MRIICIRKAISIVGARMCAYNFVNRNAWREFINEGWNGRDLTNEFWLMEWQ